MLQDEGAIVMSLANRYALAVDTQRWELFDEIFTEDVVSDYGPTAIWKDLASFKQDSPRITPSSIARSTPCRTCAGSSGGAKILT